MRYCLLLMIVFACMDVFSQDENIHDDKPVTISKKNDIIVINLLNNYWLNVKSPMKQMPVSVGIEMYFFQKLFKSDRTFNASIGLGFSSHNLHHNSLPYDSLGITYFKLIPPGIEYTKNKLTINFIELPLELNVVTKSDKRNRNLRIAIGSKGGIMLNNYLKYVGKDFRTNVNKDVKFKEYRLENLLWYRYGFYFRINYARMGLIANYYLSTIFEKNKGPNFIPFTYGLTFSIK